MVDINGVELQVGDYVAYPNQGSLEVAKVLKIIPNSYREKVKLSCEIYIHPRYMYKQRGTGILSLDRHNSYFYRNLYSFIILNISGDPVDEKVLKSRQQILKHEKESKQ